MGLAGLRRFFRDRYGMDRLNAALLLACLALLTPALLVSPWFFAGVLIPGLWMLLRAFSRDYDTRRAEEGRFRRLAIPVRRLRGAVRRDRSYRYYRCAACGRSLRAPRQERSAVCRCACGERLNKGN